MPAEQLRADEIACLMGAESTPIPEADVEVPSTVAEPPREPADAQLLEAVGCGESLAELPFSAEVKFTFQSVCEELADRLTRGLKQLLGCEVVVRCGDIFADTFAAWILGMDQPTCFLVASLSPLEGRLLWDLPPGFVFPVLEQLLGGQPSASGQLRRALTELEQRLTMRLSDVVLESYAAAWQSLVSLQPTVERMENNPRVVRCLPALEPILITTLAISFEGVDGTIRVAVPLRGAVAACQRSQFDQDRPADPQDRLSPPVSPTRELTVNKAAARDLRDDQDVRIARDMLASFDLTKEGILLGRADLIESQGRRTIRIREVISQSECQQ